MNLKSKIREIPNWPIKDVNFKDITTLLQDKKVFRYVIDEMAKPFLNKKIDKIVAIDARGFILASPIAYKLNTGVCLVRKKGKLPYKTISATYMKEYGPDTLTIHKDTIKPGEKVLVVDDLLATGGTLGAAVKLIEKLGGKIQGISLIIDLQFLGGSQKFKKYNLHYLVSYDKE
ncbi:MAG: adenine phosphoribosyltransferase [Candidatus Moranbacteria bacterium]|nr:adenine phosphoribosyltransferase [Candidatus Moranbacteria bacterium]